MIGEGRYYTQALSSFAIDIVEQQRSGDLAQLLIGQGKVRITSQVTGYLRRDEVTHDVLDQTPLDMPERSMVTEALWWCIPQPLVDALGWPALQLGSALHAMEHTAIGLLPAFAPCDRWDIGGLSTASHPDTGLPTVFVHDGQPGGGGFARRGYEVITDWLAATLERLTSCPCSAGCPACVVSPKCGNANQALNKADAAGLLGRALQANS